MSAIWINHSSQNRYPQGLALNGKVERIATRFRKRQKQKNKNVLIFIFKQQNHIKKAMPLYNSIDSKVLKATLMAEPFARKTISLYRYFILDNPQGFRDQLYREWTDLNCFGRIYIAREGINAQMSVPEDHFDAFLQSLKNYPIRNTHLCIDPFAGNVDSSETVEI